MPEKYIEYVLTRLKNEGIREEVLEDLLPYSRTFQDICIRNRKQDCPQYHDGTGNQSCFNMGN
nr:hypothetical protein [Faecalibaculum rodentium]